MAKRLYPHAWQLCTDGVISLGQAALLRCDGSTEEGCTNDYTTPGGLVNINAGVGEPMWRCAYHREAINPSPHRLDLIAATDRAIKLAVRQKLEDIAAGRTTVESELSEKPKLDLPEIQRE